MAIQNFFTSRDNNLDGNTYVGQFGRLWYNPDTNSLYASDGVTVGGVPVDLAANANAVINTLTVTSITSTSGTVAVTGNLTITGNISPATEVKIGGVKAGPGANISNDGTLTIDTTGLPLSFGDFTADENILTLVNVDQDMVLATKGEAEVQLVGNIGFYRTNGFPPDIGNRYFSAGQDGQITILVPDTDPLLGAVEIIGSASGLSVAPAVSGVMLHITGQPNQSSSIYNDGIGNNPNFIGRRYNGNVASPTQVLSGQTIVRFSGQGYSTGGFNPPADGTISLDALEDFTQSNQGAIWRFLVNPVGGNIRQEVANITVADGVTATKFTTSGTVSATGNITGDSFIGDGSQLTDLPPPTVLSAVASTNVIVADSLTATTITGMTLTPPAGTYLATFNSQYTAPALGSVTAQAAADLATLYAELQALDPTVTDHASTYGNGETLGPGVYTQAAATTLAGTLTLNGSATDIFVFRINGTLTANNNASIVLTGGAVSSNVWWVTQGAITTGNNVTIRGSLLANQAAVSTGTGTSVQGRLLAVNGAISIVTTTLTAPTGTSVLDQGSLILFSIFAGIGALTNSGASTIALSIGTNDGTITGFSTATIGGEIYPAGSPNLAIIAYGIYVDGVLIADSKRGQTQTRLQSGWPMTTQTLATVTAGQTVDVRATVPIGGFDIGPGMSLVLIPVTVPE